MNNNLYEIELNFIEKEASPMIIYMHTKHYDHTYTNLFTYFNISLA
jgi:hypothetical protein